MAPIILARDQQEEVMVALLFLKKKAKQLSIQLKMEPVYLFIILKKNICKAQKY